MHLLFGLNRIEPVFQLSERRESVGIWLRETTLPMRDRDLADVQAGGELSLAPAQSVS